MAMLPRETVRIQRSRATRLSTGTGAETQREGRTCRADRCDTILSRYNPSPTCNAHAGWRDSRKRRYD